MWIRALESSRAISRVNPAQVRYFAKSEGRQAKTDTLDAQLLVAFAQEKRPKCDILPSVELRQLQNLVSRREQLVCVHAQQQVQYQQLRCEQLRLQTRTLLDLLRQQIQTLQKQIGQLRDQGEFKAKAQRMEQLPGVGPMVSSTLLALLPELGRDSDPKISALAGLAPHPYDSGPMKGQRHIQGGRARVRRVLYMAAITSLTHNPIFKAYYQRLRQRGKPPKVVITAIMRKILCLLNKLLSNPNFTLAT